MSAERELRFSYADSAAITERWKTAGGMEFLREIGDGKLPSLPILDLLGIRFTKVGDGFVELSLIPKDYALNLAGSLHGGVTATALDSALTCSALTRLPVGKVINTIDFQVRFFRPIRESTGVLHVRGEVLNLGTTLATTTATMHDARGRLMAHASSTLAILDAQSALTDRRA
ncbi:MAG: PaaI family thioesterase [Candidatus Eremiobacteraeota bacterium]|nr:PaaI family thioesterase [Candidatus Eremiobacteraeota bacterium]